MRATLLLWLCGTLGVAFAQDAPVAAHPVAAHPKAAQTVAAHPTATQLVGAWRLLYIDVTSRTGKTADPFYEAGSVGVIVYDPAGWMSVQISGPHRAAWPVPETRSAATSGQDRRSKSAAYDSYYAYFGTWEYDQATGVMTHHVKSSLIPAETGRDYTQVIGLEGNHMIFTGHAGDITRTKVWERLEGP